MVLGFAGVLVILRPSGMINAMTKKLVRTDRPWGITFWMFVSQALLPCLYDPAPGGAHLG